MTRFTTIIFGCALILFIWGCAKEESCDPVAKVSSADGLLMDGGIEDTSIRSRALTLYTEALECDPPAKQSELEFVQSHAHFGLALVSLFNTASLLDQAISSTGGTGTGQCGTSTQGEGGLSFQSVVVPILKSTIEPIIGHLEEVTKYSDFSLRYSRANFTLLKATGTSPGISINLGGNYDLGEVYFFLGLVRIIEGAVDFLFAYDGIFDSILAGLTCTQGVTNPLLDPDFGKISADGTELLLETQRLLGGGFDAWTKGMTAAMNRKSDSFADGWFKDQSTGEWVYNKAKSNDKCDGCEGDPSAADYAGEYYTDRNGNGRYDDPTEHFFYFRDWGVPLITSTTQNIVVGLLKIALPASYPSSKETEGVAGVNGKFSPNSSEADSDPEGDNHHPCSLQELVNGTPCGEKDGVRQRDASGTSFIEDIGWEERNKVVLFNLMGLIELPFSLAAGPEDTGIDGLPDVKEPGYDIDCNPDPFNDDAQVSHIYFPLFAVFMSLPFNPSACAVQGLSTCFEGDGIWEPGEPFHDYGTDNVPDTKEVGFKSADPDGDDYDPILNPAGTENNGKYDKGEPWSSLILARLLLLLLKSSPDVLDILGEDVGGLIGPYLDLEGADVWLATQLEPIFGAAVSMEIFENLWSDLASSIQGTKPFDITPTLPVILQTGLTLFPDLTEGLGGEDIGAILGLLLGKMTPVLAYQALNLPAFDLSVLFTRHVSDLKSLLPLYYQEDEPYTDVNGNGKYDPPEPFADGWFTAPTEGWYYIASLKDGVCNSCSENTIPCRGTSCGRFKMYVGDPDYEGEFYTDDNNNGILDSTDYNGRWDPGEPFSEGTIHIPAGWHNQAAFVNGICDICDGLTTSTSYMGEWYEDMDQDGEWDAGEPFQDLNADGEWNAGGTFISQAEYEVAFHPTGKECGDANMYCPPDLTPGKEYPGDPYSDAGTDRVADKMERGYSLSNLDPSMDNENCDEGSPPYTPFPSICGEKNKIRDGWDGNLEKLFGVLGAPAPLRDHYHVWPDYSAIDDPNSFSLKLGFPGLPIPALIALTIEDSAYVFYPDPTIGGLFLFPTFHLGQTFSALGFNEGEFKCGKVSYASTMTNKQMNQYGGCVTMIGSAVSAAGCLPGGMGGCSGGCAGCSGGGCGGCSGGGCPMAGACPIGSCEVVPHTGIEIGVNLHALLIPLGLIIALRRKGSRRRG